VGPTKTKQTQQEGLKGFFGHAFTEDNGAKRIQYQFQVLRRVDAGAVQLFSFMDGGPTIVKVFCEDHPPW
jgi:hypothetical protein